MGVRKAKERRIPRHRRANGDTIQRDPELGTERQSSSAAAWKGQLLRIFQGVYTARG